MPHLQAMRETGTHRRAGQQTPSRLAGRPALLMAA